MNIKYLASKVAKFAESNKDGFTLCIKTLKPVTTGIVVSYKDTQNSFGKNELQAVINHAISHDGIVGGWLDNESGRYYFDSCKVFSPNELADAIQFGIDNQQLAIFDIDNMREIRLNV